KFGPPGPDQPGEADDLAAPDRKIDRAIWVGCRADVLENKNFRSRCILRLRIERLQVAADHETYHAVVVYIGLLQHSGYGTISKRNNAVRALLDFMQAMGDEDDADAARLQFGHDLEQAVGLRQRQARGGLVHDHDLRAQRERLGDLDKLALGEREIGNRRVGLEVRAEPVEQGLGARLYRSSIDQLQRRE